MKQSILLLCSIALSFQANAEPLTLERALRMAQTRSPELEAARLEVQAAERAVDAAGRWTNPVLEFEVEKFGGDRDIDAGEYTFALSKSFQRGGKRKAEKNRAREARTAADHQFDETTLALKASVRKAFYEVLAQQEIGKVRTEQEQLGRAFVEVAERRLRAGGGSELEVVQAELELEEILLQQTCCFGDLAAAREHLASLIGLPADELEEVTEAFFELPGLIPIQLDEAYPTLQHMDARIREMQYEAARAGAGDSPDISLAAGFRHDADSSINSFLVGASLPLTFNRQGAREQAALQTGAEALQAYKAEIRRKLQSEMAQISARYVGAKKETELISDRLIPKAEQAYELSREGYEAGRFSWIELIAAQQHLMELRVRQVESLLNAHLIRAEWIRFNKEGIDV